MSIFKRKNNLHDIISDAVQTFNEISRKAEPLREGFKVLQDESGGKIKITETRDANDGGVHFETNIPTTSSRNGASTFSVKVFPDGDVLAWGNTNWEGCDPGFSRTDASEEGVKKVVAYAARYAAIGGLLP